MARLESCCGSSILSVVETLSTALRSGHKLLLCGNGGSAAQCQHWAAEFTGRLTQTFVRSALAAIALTTDTSYITAFCNDVGFDDLFARQVEALGLHGDVLIGISTSGASRNVMRAVVRAGELGLQTVVLTGESGPLQHTADQAIAIPHTDTQIVQEAHVAVYHVICDLVERQLFGQQEPQAQAD
jgi:D-sedoheptulose 7-phosphate isomerase